MDSSVKCGNCRFSWISSGDYLYCRKNPAFSTGRDSKFPVVDDDNWCGEFKRKLIHEEDNRNLEPQKLVKRQCGNCKHFQTEKGAKIKDIEGGFCAYNPPILTGARDMHFPRIHKESSCSKFRAREIIIEEPQNVLTSGKRAITFGDS